jgi:hypothetical protein
MIKMYYTITDLKTKETVDQFEIKGLILPNLDREEMFSYCQKIIDQFEEELVFLKPICLEKFKKKLIQEIQKTSQRKHLYHLLEQNANLLLENNSDENQEKETRQKLHFLVEFQKFLLKYLWRVESKFFGEIK